MADCVLLLAVSQRREEAMKSVSRGEFPLCDALYEYLRQQFKEQ